MSLVEWGYQFENAASGWREAWLARNGEFFLETGVDKADWQNDVIHGEGVAAVEAVHLSCD